MKKIAQILAAGVIATGAFGAVAYADNLDAAEHSPVQAFPGGVAPQGTYGYSAGKNFLTSASKSTDQNRIAADRALGAQMDHDANAR